jgi:hypothetical protein
VHVEAVQDGEQAARELLKYMLKDIMADGGNVPPAVFALVFRRPWRATHQGQRRRP